MDAKKLKQLLLFKRLLGVTIIAYVVVFVLMNTSYLSIDNIRRFSFSAKTALTQTSASDGNIISYSSGSIPSFAPFKDGFVVLESSSVSVYSRDNVKFSSHTINYRNPVLRTSDKYILCYDRGGKNLCVYDSFDILFEKEFSDVIINATVDNDGRVAVLTEKYGYKGLLTVFGKSFEEKFMWYSAESYLVDVAFTTTNSVAVVSIVSNMENIDTVVYTLNYSVGEERSKVTYSNVFPLSVVKKSDNSIEILSESGLVSFRNGGSNLIYSYGARVPEKFYQGDKYTVFAYELHSQDEWYTVYVTDITGNKQFEVSLQNVVSVCSFADTIFVLTSDSIISFDRTGAVVSQNDTLSSDLTGIVPGKQKCIVYGADKAYILFTSDLLK